MAMRFVVDAGFIAVERDVAAIRLGGPNVVAPRGSPPDGLFFRIDNGWLGKFFHLMPPGEFYFTIPIATFFQSTRDDCEVARNRKAWFTGAPVESCKRKQAIKPALRVHGPMNTSDVKFPFKSLS